MLQGDRALVRKGLRACLSSPRAAFLVTLSILALSALFLGSWLIFMPVAALVVAPTTLAVSFLLGFAPSALPNSLAAVALSGTFAGATVAAAFRVLLRRARARGSSALAAWNQA